MNPKIRALLWEQFMVAGTLTLWVFTVVGSFLFFTTLTQYRLLKGDDYDVLAGFLIMSLALLFLLRQNVAGHLDLKFEPRLSRLPVTNLPLALIPVGMRLVCLVLFYLALRALYWLLFRETISTDLLIYACTLYTVAQALLWTRMYLLLVPIPVIGSVYLFLLTFDFIQPNNEFGKMVDAAILDDFPRFCLSLLPLALYLIFVGVRWERRNEQKRLFSFEGVANLSQDWRRSLSHEFSSVAEARVWFEQNKSGINITILTGLIMVIFYPALFSIPDFRPVRHGDTFFYPYAYAQTLPPYFPVLLVALVVGLIREFSRQMWPLSLTEFHRTKPVSDAHLAWCHILVMTRYTFIALIVVFVLVHIFNMYFLSPELRILATAFDEPDTALFPVAWLIEPLFLGCVLAWLALWCTRPLVVGALIALVGLFTNLLVFGFGILFVYIFIAYLLVRSARLLYHSWQENVLPRRVWYVYLALHVILPLLIWFPGPPELASKPDSLFITCAFTALLLSPILALPQQIARKRALA